MKDFKAIGRAMGRVDRTQRKKIGIRVTHCENCKATNPDHVKICWRCGATLKKQKKRRQP